MSECVQIELEKKLPLLLMLLVAHPQDLPIPFVTHTQPNCCRDANDRLAGKGF